MKIMKVVIKCLTHLKTDFFNEKPHTENVTWLIGEVQGWVQDGTASPNDFCPSPKSPKDFCPMGRLWDSQNSSDCLRLESQGQSRDQSPKCSQSLGFGCPRDFCPGTVQRYFPSRKRPKRNSPNPNPKSREKSSM